MDHAFLASLTSPDELSGLFNKVINMLPDLLDRGEFTNQMSIEDAHAMYKDRSVPEEAFFEQFVYEAPGESTEKSMLAMYFNEYCEILGLPQRSRHQLSRYITSNVDWIQRRAVHDGKEDHMSNYSARKKWKDCGGLA